MVHTYSFPRRCTGILVRVGLVAKNRWQVQRREFLFFQKSDSNKGGCWQLLQILSCSLVVSTQNRFQDRRENGKTARRGNFHDGLCSQQQRSSRAHPICKKAKVLRSGFDFSIFLLRR